MTLEDRHARQISRPNAGPNGRWGTGLSRIVTPEVLDQHRQDAKLACDILIRLGVLTLAPGMTLVFDANCMPYVALPDRLAGSVPGKVFERLAIIIEETGGQCSSIEVRAALDFIADHDWTCSDDDENTPETTFGAWRDLLASLVDAEDGLRYSLRQAIDAAKADPAGFYATDVRTWLPGTVARLIGIDVTSDTTTG